MSEFLQIIQDNRVQIFSILGSVGLFLFIVHLIQRRKLKEEHSILWLTVFAFFIIISVFRPFLDVLAKLAGIYYAPAALLLFLILGILIILIHYSIIISKLSEQNKNLIQEVALLKEKIQPGKKEDK